MISIVEKVVYQVQLRLMGDLDPLSHLKNQIERIEMKLQDKREKWSKKNNIKMAKKA